MTYTVFFGVHGDRVSEAELLAALDAVARDFAMLESGELVIQAERFDDASVLEIPRLGRRHIQVESGEDLSGTGRSGRSAFRQRSVTSIFRSNLLKISSTSRCTAKVPGSVVMLSTL